MGYKLSLRSEIEACLTLALPLAGAQLAQAATSFADTVMMGLLGSNTLAAGGLGAAVFAALLIVSTGIISAVSPLVAEAYGAEQIDRAGKIAQQGLWLALGLAIPIMVLTWNMGAIMHRLGQDAQTVDLAEEYLRAIVWGFVPGLAFAALRSFVAAVSQPRPIMVMVVIGTVCNVIGNYVLMFGKLGLPAMGLAGIGAASSISMWIMFLGLAFHILRDRSLQRYNIPKQLHIVHPKMLWEIVQIGWPIGVLVAMETGLFTVTTFLMGRLGTIPLAAHQIAIQTASITFMVPLGIAYATTVRVGQTIGQGDAIAARRAGYVGISLGAVFMLIMGTIMWFTPRSIISLYIDVNNPNNQEVATTAAAFLGVAALFQLVDGIQVTASGALRGLKDTQVPMLIGLVAYWGFGLTSGYLLGLRLNWGGVGLWLGLAAGLAIAAIVLTWRFHSLTRSAKLHQAQ